MKRPDKQFHIAIDETTCVQCAGCVSICPTEALHMEALQLTCDDPLCIGCDLCVRFCPVVALTLEDRSAQQTAAEAHSPTVAHNTSAA